MSTDEEIRAVYEQDIAEKTQLVESKFGKAPFYDNFDGFSIGHLYGGLGIENIKCLGFAPKSKKKHRCR